MTNDDYVSALVAYGKSGAYRLQILQARVDALFSVISLNNGQDLVGVALPGQHLAFSRMGNTVQDEFAAVTLALSIISGSPNIIRTASPVFW